MEQDSNLDSNVYGQGSIASSSENNFSSTVQNDLPEPSSSAHGTKRRHSQSTETNLEPVPKRSNKADTSCSTNSEELLRRFEQAILLIKILQDKIEEKDMELKLKQVECEQKDNHLKVYFSLINKLEKDCNEKIKQLAERNALIDHLKLETIANDKRLAAFSNHSNPDAVNELQEICNSKDAELIEMKSKIKRLEAEAAQKDTQLKTYADQLQSKSTEIYELQSQSDNKDTQLADMESKVKQLEEEVAKQNSQLQSKTAEICELQTQSGNKDLQLIENDRMINELQKASIKKDDQLIEKTNTISNLQAIHDNEKAQMAEKTNLVEQLQLQCMENKSQMQVISETLKNFEDKINSYFITLFDRAEKHKYQKQYDKAIMDYDTIIELEQAAYNRPDKLIILFVNKTFCYGALKSHQQAIDAASSVLQYDSKCKEALYNRAFAYYESKQYKSAHRDLENVLKLDPAYEKARNLLEQVQKCINKGTSSQFSISSY